MCKRQTPGREREGQVNGGHACTHTHTSRMKTTGSLHAGVTTAQVGTHKHTDTHILHGIKRNS